MEVVSFQNVNHFVPKQAEKEQKQSADRESFQDIMKKAPEQAQTEKEQEDVSKSEKKDPIVQNGNFVLQSQLLIVQAPVQEAVQQGQENPMTETVPGELSAGTVPENAEWTGSQQVMSGIETAENAGMLIDDASRQEAQRLPEKTEVTPETLQTTDNGQTTSKTTVSETAQTENQTGNGVQSGDPFKEDRKEELEKSSDLDRLTETQPGEKPEESNVATVGRQDAAEHTSGAVRESGKREQIQGPREVLTVSKPEELPQELTRQLLVKASSGRNEFEIQITPKHLGEITVRIAQEDGCSVVSIICSECKGNRKCDGTESRKTDRDLCGRAEERDALAGRTAGSGSFRTGIGAVSAERRTGKNAESREYPVSPGIETGTDRVGKERKYGSQQRNRKQQCIQQSVRDAGRGRGEQQRNVHG